MTSYTTPRSRIVVTRLSGSARAQAGARRSYARSDAAALPAPRYDRRAHVRALSALASALSSRAGQPLDPRRDERTRQGADAARAVAEYEADADDGGAIARAVAACQGDRRAARAAWPERSRRDPTSTMDVIAGSSSRPAASIFGDNEWGRTARVGIRMRVARALLTARCATFPVATRSAK